MEWLSRFLARDPTLYVRVIVLNQARLRCRSCGGVLLWELGDHAPVITTVCCRWSAIVPIAPHQDLVQMLGRELCELLKESHEDEA